MGFGTMFAAATGFRFTAGVLGMVIHLSGYAVLPINPPAGALMIATGEGVMSMVVAPPGTNPIENYVVSAAAVSSPL